MKEGIYELVHSLSPTEKKLFTQLTNGFKDYSRFKQLFNALVKQNTYQPNKIISTLYNNDNKQFNNDVSYLEKVILKVLIWNDDTNTKRMDFIYRWLDSEKLIQKNLMVYSQKAIEKLENSTNDNLILKVLSNSLSSNVLRLMSDKEQAKIYKNKILPTVHAQFITSKFYYYILEYLGSSFEFNGIMNSEKIIQEIELLIEEKEKLNYKNTILELSFLQLQVFYYKSIGNINQAIQSNKLFLDLMLQEYNSSTSAAAQYNYMFHTKYLLNFYILKHDKEEIIKAFNMYINNNIKINASTKVIKLVEYYKFFFVLYIYFNINDLNTFNANSIEYGNYKIKLKQLYLDQYYELILFELIYLVKLNEKTTFILSECDSKSFIVKYIEVLIAFKNNHFDLSLSLIKSLKKQLQYAENYDSELMLLIIKFIESCCKQMQFNYTGYNNLIITCNSIDIKKYKRFYMNNIDIIHVFEITCIDKS